MLGLVASDANTKKASDFAFIDNFNFLCKFRDDRIVKGDKETADVNIVDIDTYYEISMDVDVWISFKSLKSHTYNDLREK